MSFWERIKAFFEEEDIPRTTPLDEWTKHELTIKCLAHITQAISQQCSLAEKHPIRPGSRSGFRIAIYSYRIEISSGGSDDYEVHSRLFFETLGYDRLTERQAPQFAKAIYQKLYETYSANQKIRFVYSYDSSWEPHGCISVDITDYHPQLKRVNL